MASYPTLVPSYVDRYQRQLEALPSTQSNERDASCNILCKLFADKFPELVEVYTMTLTANLWNLHVTAGQVANNEVLAVIEKELAALGVGGGAGGSGGGGGSSPRGAGAAGLSILAGRGRRRLLGRDVC